MDSPLLPLVSIVIPTHNRAFCIARAIESVQKQSYKNIEIIVVDDASADETKSIVEGIQSTDSRVRYIPLTKNIGVSSARNVGFEKVKGAFVNYLDSDDELHPGSLNALVTNLNNSQFDFVIARFDHVYSEVYQRGISDPLKLIELICKNEHFCIATILWPTNFIKQYNIRFKDGLRVGSDKLFLIDALQRATAVKLIQDEVLKVNEDSTNSIRKQHKKLWHKMEYLKGRWLILVHASRSLNLKVFLLSFKQFAKAIRIVFYHILKGTKQSSSS